MEVKVSDSKKGCRDLYKLVNNCVWIAICLTLIGLVAMLPLKLLIYVWNSF